MPVYHIAATEEMFAIPPLYPPHLLDASAGLRSAPHVFFHVVGFLCKNENSAFNVANDCKAFLCSVSVCFNKFSVLKQ